MSDCCQSGNATMILACAGGSNVGQMTNRLAVDLTGSGLGKVACLAGIGARLPGFVQAAKDAESILVLDGCPIACARKTLEAVGVNTADCYVLTEMGMEKNKQLALDEQAAMKLKTTLVAALDKQPAGRPASGAKPCACS